MIHYLAYDGCPNASRSSKACEAERRRRRGREMESVSGESEGSPCPSWKPRVGQVLCRGQCRLHRRTEIQGLPICRRSGNAEWRRNSDHSADAGILLRRGPAKASSADGETWFQAESKA